MQKMQSYVFRNRLFLYKFLFLSFLHPSRKRRSPNGSQRRFSRCVMRKNDNVEDDASRVASRWASGPAKSGSDRGQFVDVIVENASRAGAVSESVEWSSGRSVVIFNFSIKAQVGRLMVAICSFACVSAVDLTSNGRSLVARNRQRACNSSGLPGAPTWDAAT